MRTLRVSLRFRDAVWRSTPTQTQCRSDRSCRPRVASSRIRPLFGNLEITEQGAERPAHVGLAPRVLADALDFAEGDDGGRFAAHSSAISARTRWMAMSCSTSSSSRRSAASSRARRRVTLRWGTGSGTFLPPMGATVVADQPPPRVQGRPRPRPPPRSTSLPISANWCSDIPTSVKFRRTRVSKSDKVLSRRLSERVVWHGSSHTAVQGVN